jgi:serine/threonine-protein kinase
MEYCNLGSVDLLLKLNGGRLPLETAMHIVLQALDGLEYAHNAKISVTLKDGSVKNVNGLVHRDISPHNIFLCGDSKNPVAKVADYGLAKAFETAGMTGRTRTGASAGKPVFMPRQQAINYKYSKPDVDVWAAAASLYYMLTGEFPKEFSSGEDFFRVALNSQIVPINKRPFASKLPAKLVKVINEALDDSGDLKFKSAKELKRALERAL